MQNNYLHEKFVEYGKSAKELQRKCALLLPEINRKLIWRQKGFDSIYVYAAKLAGMSRIQVDDALRILRRIADKPALMALAEEKGLNAVRPVASIATTESAKYWALKAKSMSKNELETFVRDIRRKEESLANCSTAPQSPITISQAPSTEIFDHLSPQPGQETLMMNLKPEVAAKLKHLNISGWNDLMEEFINLYQSNLEQQKPPVKENASHSIPRAIQKYVTKRCRGKCEFPGCNKKYDHLHHTNRFASNKVHDPDQIVALCTAHHSLAHKGLIANESLPAEKWQIQKHPDLANLNWYIDQKVQDHKRQFHRRH